MSLVVIQHCPPEGPAVLGTTLQGYGHCLYTVKPYAGQPLPPIAPGVDGVIAMGGPMNVDQTDQYPWLQDELQYLQAAHEAGVPIVGICLGAQLIAAALGGQVGAMAQPEVGWQRLTLAFPGTVDPMLAGIGWDTIQFHLHGQEVTRLPPNATPLAGSQACKHQAFRVGQTTYGFQYHFEWDHQDLQQMVKDPLVAQVGLSGDQLLHEADTHYHAYRRLGDRLCHTITTALFPIDKRLAG